MSWAKLDDQIAFHPKVMEAGNEAFGAWVRMLAHCCAQLTDGHISSPSALAFASAELLEKLVAVGLLDRVERGYRIHDFHDWNPSAESVRAKRKSDLARKNKGRAAQVRGPDGRMTSAHIPAGIRTDIQSDTQPESERNHTGIPPVPSPSQDSSCWSAHARDSNDHADESVVPGAEIASGEPADAVVGADGLSPETVPVDAALPHSRPSNGHPEGGSPDAAAVGPADADDAEPKGPDLIAMAHYLVRRGIGFGQKMLDLVASGKTLQTGHRETIRRLYAEQQEVEAMAERASQLKAAGPVRADASTLTEVERQALELWEHQWSREHRGETYPTTDRDRGHIRKLTGRATERARAIGADVRVSDVLKHYFSRYLALDDKRLIAERYPLSFLESRLPAIGEYESVKIRPVAAPPPPPREHTPIKVPDGVLEQIAAPRTAEDALRARRAQ